MLWLIPIGKFSLASSCLFDTWIGILGYRDVSINLCLVGVEAIRLGLDRHICEVQLLLRQFADLKVVISSLPTVFVMYIWSRHTKALKFEQGKICVLILLLLKFYK